MTRRPKAVPQQPFRFIRWFCALSLIPIVLISTVSASLLSEFLTRNVVQRDAVTAMQFVNSIVRAQDAMSYFDDEAISPAAPELEQFFEHVSRLPDVLRANVYAQDRRILWSSNRELIGMNFSDNQELELAFSGQLNPNVEFFEQGEKQEHVFFDTPSVRFVEYYLPIWSDDRRSVVGVVEVYRWPRSLLEAIRHGQRLVWISAIAGGLFLFAALFWIVHRANKQIQQQQARLVESEKLAVVGEMTAAIAHGLRNPLAAIRSSAELMLEDDLEDQTRTCASQIVAQSDRLADWIRAFLIGAQKMDGESGNAHLSDVISDSVSVFADQMKDRRIELTLKLRNNLPPLEADSAALSQAFNSVFANCIEAMPQGGQLVVESDLARRTGFVGVAITDSGGGISEREVGSVFEPFVTTKGAGLGIGLPIAKRVIERFGGSIKLGSQEGQGTTVTILLPVEG